MRCRVICVVCIPNVCSLIEQPQKLLYKISCDFIAPIAKHSPSQHVIWTKIDKNIFTFTFSSLTNKDK